MIEIADFLDPAAVKLELAAENKHDALSELAALLFSAFPALNKVMPVSEATEILVKRESLAATGVGNGVAIPHAASERLTRLYGGVARSTAGIDFGAADGRRCHLFIVMLCPSTNPKLRIKALSRISRALGDTQRRRAMLAADSAEALYRILVPDIGSEAQDASG